MFEKITKNLKNKINTIKEENDNYKKLLESTTTLNNFYEIKPINNEISEHKISFITTNCPDINKVKANLIASLIPISETYLEAYYAKEILTNKEYYIIPTNKNLWFISLNEYKIFTHDNNKITIIKNNMMSKIILFNNVLLEINGNNEKITKLINLIENPHIRQQIIEEHTKYLCGIIPIYQKLNSINSGISIDKNKNIIIHNKETNYICNITDIINYEILLDNQTYFSKNNYSKTTMTTFQNSCYKMSIRITLTNNFQIIIPILEPNNLGTKYQSHDTTFQENLNFATNIINKIEELSIT